MNIFYVVFQMNSINKSKITDITCTFNFQVFRIVAHAHEVHKNS